MAKLGPDGLRKSDDLVLTQTPWHSWFSWNLISILLDKSAITTKAQYSTSLKALTWASDFSVIASNLLRRYAGPVH
jgi:hypothetical protein